MYATRFAAGFRWLTLLLMLACIPMAVQAQELRPRFGLSFGTMFSTTEGVGLSFRGRASAPVNADLSFAIDLGLTGFVLEGRDEASYVFDPQVSAIITLPGIRTAPYLLAGVGAFVPIESENTSNSGPVVHFGVGWVRALNETTLFYEINPELVIAKEQVEFAFPIRVGLIF